MRAELIYNSTACNATVKALDWGQNNLICYASCNSVTIYNPKYPGTNKDLKILTRHKEKVCAVKWIKKSVENELISTSNDGTAIVWNVDKFEPVILKGHTDGVNRVDCIYTDTDIGSLVVATASIDSTIKIWYRAKYGADIENIQTIDLKRGLCVGMSLCYLPRTKNLILACGRDTSAIELYVQTDFGEKSEFKLAQTLRDHENWVPGVDFTLDDRGDLLLATSSQDKFIRLWRISELKTQKDVSTNKFLINKKFIVNTVEGEIEFITTLESVLCGHEGWVYEVLWAPKEGKSQPMKLISCSLDKTIIIWTLDEPTGLWIESVRVGEIGGNTLGFYGCKFSPDSESIIGHGYLGSFHLWNHNKETGTWEPGVSPSGHSGQVVDVSWEPRGQYIISASTDQTTRIHAPWVHENKVSWHEIARPQVHGYDMSCLAVLSRYRFVSGAEEKIIRTFEAPSNFFENFQHLCNITEDKEYLNANSGPKGASVPSLGLSNKAVYDSSNEDQIKPTGKEYYPEETYFHEVHLNAPPTEEDLIQNTLWPEVQKLYGHGYEVFSVACSHDGKLVASSCKSTTPQHASIILWDAEQWQQKQILPSHTLTVTQIAFSPDDTKILSVSRDRRLSVFEKNSSGEYQLAATTDKKTGVHTRIIWCCSWSHDSNYFITGSREGKVVIWRKNLDKIDVNTPLRNYESVDVLEIKDQSVTAVDFAPCFIGDEYLVSLGFDSGEICFYSWSPKESWKKQVHIDASCAHHKTVRRIRFRPIRGQAGTNNEDNVLQIVTCGSDNSVKIHNLYLK